MSDISSGIQWDWMLSDSEWGYQWGVRWDKEMGKVSAERDERISKIMMQFIHE